MFFTALTAEVKATSDAAEEETSSSPIRQTNKTSQWDTRKTQQPQVSSLPFLLHKQGKAPFCNPSPLSQALSEGRGREKEHNYGDLQHLPSPPGLLNRSPAEPICLKLQAVLVHQEVFPQSMLPCYH